MLKSTNKTTVLVIDDEQSFLDVITNVLKSSDFKIIQALDGKMGVFVARKFLPDIIISDWEMPVMDGIEAIRILKEDELTKDIPVIMATGRMTSSHNLKTALKAGAIDFIRKPIDPLELISRMNSALLLSNSISEIKKQNAELVQLNATKNKLFSIIAHDLRTPFNAILSYVRLIVNPEFDVSDEMRLKLNNQLHLSATSGSALLDNLLTWARSQQNSITLNTKAINLKELVSESISPYLSFAETKKIKVEEKVSPDIFIKVDHYTILTTIGNLVNNAIKFTDIGGSITISSDVSASFAALNIDDTGVGISEDGIEGLFKIERNNSTRGTNGEKGTGLGLILSKEFAEKNGGTIQVESQLSKGTRFILTLPKSDGA